MEFVDTRRVGDAFVAIIWEGTGRWAPDMQMASGRPLPDEEWRRVMPDADASGAVELVFNSVHIRHGGASILIDCPLSDRESDDAGSLLDLERTPGREAGLSTIGVQPEDVTHVVFSHPHGDHIGGATVERNGQRMARFPNARHLINRADWEPDRGRSDPLGMAALRLGTIENLGLLDLVDGDHEVVPGVTMVHAPGESPGHSVVRLVARGRTFYHLADLFHFLCEVEHQDWAPRGVDIATAMQTRRRLISAALEANALATFSHARFPGWGHLVGNPDRAEWHWASISPQQ